MERSSLDQVPEHSEVSSLGRAMEANLQLHQTSIQAVPERRNTVNPGRQRHSFKQQMNRKHQSMMQN